MSDTPWYANLQFGDMDVQILMLAVASAGIKTVKAWRDTDKGQRSKVYFHSATQFLTAFIIYYALLVTKAEFTTSAWFDAFFLFLLGSAFTRNILNAYFNKDELVGKAIDYDSFFDHTIAGIYLMAGFYSESRGGEIVAWYMLLPYLVASNAISYAGFWAYRKWKNANVYYNLAVEKPATAFKIIGVALVHAAFSYGFWFVDDNTDWWTNSPNGDDSKRQKVHAIIQKPMMIWAFAAFLFANTFIAIIAIKPKSIVPATKPAPKPKNGDYKSTDESDSDSEQPLIEISP